MPSVPFIVSELARKAHERRLAACCEGEQVASVLWLDQCFNFVDNLVVELSQYAGAGTLFSICRGSAAAIRHL